MKEGKLKAEPDLLQNLVFFVEVRQLLKHIMYETEFCLAG